jgi:UDP-N-acetylmuramoyl-tripeptide--D-alanyl-D-alanine ligase
MAPSAPAGVVTYGLDPGNDVHAVDLAVDWPRGMRFTALVHGAPVPVRLPLLGRHMVPPALAALAVAAGEGLPLERAAAAIASLPPAAARLEVVPLPDGTTLLCDHHKNSLATVRAALELAAELPGRKLLVIARVREMGAEQADELRRAALLVARVPAEVIAIGEGVEALIQAALAAGLPAARLHRAAPGTAAALAILRRLARPGDVILLKARIRSKLERLILALQGRKVVCDLGECQLLGQDCATCPALERGAGGG